MILQALQNMFAASERDRGTVLGGLTALGSVPIADMLSSPMVQAAIQEQIGAILGGLLTPQNLKIAAIAALVLGVARMAQPKAPETA